MLSDVDRRALEARWREPHRHYHTMQHLDECLALLADLPEEAERPEEVETALWFHDAVYDPHAADNEERSAELAAETLQSGGIGADVVERVRGMILATRHAGLPSAGDAALVCDIDLAILGADGPRFDEYERQVREEYAWVPAPIYRARRAEILSGLLARPQLFVAVSLRERFEAPARANLARSVARLRAGDRSI